MSLIQCSECSREVSSQAAACPHCGCPIAPESPSKPQSQATASSQTQTYQPQQPPLKLRPFGILVGVALLVFGLWLSLSFVPAHDPGERSVNLEDPISIANALDPNQWYLEDWMVSPLKLVGWALAAIGLVQLVVGSAKRTGWLAFCQSCDMQVIARKAFVGRKCERCGARVRK